MSDSGDKTCLVITCRIDGKDSSGIGLYGVLISVVNSGALLFSGVFFSRERIDDSFSIAEMIALINSQHTEERAEELMNIESTLDDFVRTSQLFLSDKNLSDPKSLEHKITYFCTTVMLLNAITFVNVLSMAKSELREIIPSLKDYEDEDEDEEIPLSVDGGDAEDVLPEVAIRCEPVLDPVNGIPVGSINVGTMIYCKMKEDSAYYNLMAKVSPDFDGIVAGDVAGVRVNELGSATVVVRLSEGVTGAFKVATSIRLKLVEKSAAGSSKSNRFAIEIIFGVAGVIFFLCLMAILLHYLT